MAGAMAVPVVRTSDRDKASREKGGRATLVAEAVQLLSREGIDGMSIGKLAERTGYSKGGIMAHFTSKREMILALVEESVAMAREYFREELEGAKTPTERLSRTLETYGSYWTSGLFEGGIARLHRHLAEALVEIGSHENEGETAP